MKKLITSILVALILASVLPIYAFADDIAETTDVLVIKQETAEIIEEPIAYAATSSSGGMWIKESNGRWWYKHADGSYTKYNWEYIDGNWYFFDKNGWMWTEWLSWEGNWYYLNPSGVMHTGWLKDDGKWYYFTSRGIMVTGWAKIDGADYYFNSSGVMCTGWIKVNNKWYYMNTDGSMRIGWIKLNGNWYYLNTDGSMRTGWFKLNGDWYYFNSSGVMLRGWQKIDGDRYYFASDGHMVTESFTDGKRKFTFYSNGRLKSTQMNIDRIVQGNHNWCWAASAAMIGNYENNSRLTAEAIVRKFRDGNSLEVGATSPYELSQALSYALGGKETKTVYNPNFENAAYYIDKNHPFLTVLKLYAGNTGLHAVVCGGYRRNDESLYFVDPNNYINKLYIPIEELKSYIVIENVAVKLDYIVIYP